MKNAKTCKLMLHWQLLHLASLRGFEPPTSALGVQHSIQLSYRDTFLMTDPVNTEYFNQKRP